MYIHTSIPKALRPCTELPEPVARHGMVGGSPPMQRLLAQMEHIGPYFRTALVTGENGTGKQLVARGLHSLSLCAGEPFIVFNAESAENPLAIFESAHGGMLFLPEIENLHLMAQERLLRVLLQHRPGSAASRLADARIVATSSHDLKTMSASGHFRKDLYHRIALIEFKVPPLQARGEDIILLARHFVRRFAAQYGKQITGLEPAALSALAAHTWPGNVRELQQVLESAVQRCPGQTITIEDLPQLIPAAQSAWSQTVPLPLKDQPTRLDVMVQRHVCQVMEACGGNKLRAADLLGISRSTLYRMLERS